MVSVIWLGGLRKQGALTPTVTATRVLCVRPAADQEPNRPKTAAGTAAGLVLASTRMPGGRATEPTASASRHRSSFGRSLIARDAPAHPARLLGPLQRRPAGCSGCR